MNESDNDAKRASLLTMKFTVNEVDFALDKLGMAIVSKVLIFLNYGC